MDNIQICGFRILLKTCNKRCVMTPSAVLPEFQSFLLDRQFATEKTAPYCAHWVNEFSKFAENNPQLSRSDQISKFLALLDGAQTADWQITQAQDALNVYFSSTLALSRVKQDVLNCRTPFHVNIPVPPRSGVGSMCFQRCIRCGIRLSRIYCKTA
jgi:hypothetical protein